MESGAGGIPAEQFAAAVKVLKNLMRQRFAAPFLEPVAEQAAPGYHSIIKHPRDLTSTLQGLESGSYPSLGVHSSPVAQLHSGQRSTNGMRWRELQSWVFF